MSAGRSIEEILVDYPYLERADILAALEFAAAARGISAVVPGSNNTNRAQIITGPVIDLG
jgi:Protein of unknown function (DUF433)